MPAPLATPSAVAGVCPPGSDSRPLTYSQLGHRSLVRAAPGVLPSECFINFIKVVRIRLKPLPGEPVDNQVRSCCSLSFASKKAGIYPHSKPGFAYETSCAFHAVAVIHKLFSCPEG
jgi:hypothetical protein